MPSHELSHFSITVEDKNIFFTIRKNIFACLFSIHNTISLSCHEQ